MTIIADYNEQLGWKLLDHMKISNAELEYGFQSSCLAE